MQTINGGINIDWVNRNGLLYLKKNKVQPLLRQINKLTDKQNIIVSITSLPDRLGDLPYT